MKSLHKRSAAHEAPTPSPADSRNPAALPAVPDQGNGQLHLPTSLAATQARYDTGVQYDSGARYALGSPTETSPSAPVAKVKMDLKGRSDASLDYFVDNHITMITGNADFTTPKPPPAELQAAYDLYKAKLVALEQLHKLAKQATLEKNDARRALTDIMIRRGAYVQEASAGNASKIVGAGMGVANPPTPAGPLMPPMKFVATLGEVPGVMDLWWEAVAGARGYILQCSPNVMPREFVQIKNCTRTSLHLEDMTVGESLVFRIACQGGSTGQSPWSAELLRTVA